MLQVSFEQFHVRLLKYGKIDKKLSHHVRSIASESLSAVIECCAHDSFVSEI